MPALQGTTIGIEMLVNHNQRGTTTNKLKPDESSAPIKLSCHSTEANFCGKEPKIMALSAEPMIDQPTGAKVMQDFARMRLGQTELDSAAQSVASINSIFRGAVGVSKS
jgi:hypothetical protein